MKSSQPELTSEKIAHYRATAQRRRKQEQEIIMHLQEQGWEAARQAARLLMEQFQATRVVVFGSLVHEGFFHALV